MRYPFKTWTNRYMQNVAPIYAPSTASAIARRLNMIGNIFLELFDSGKISSCDPSKISSDDVLAYVAYRKRGRLKEATISREMITLEKLLLFAGNSAVGTFRSRNRSMVPVSRHQRLPALDDKAYDAILDRAAMVHEDWVTMRAYALVILALGAGLRTQELQLSEVRNIDTDDWTIYLSHVKGEKTYGLARLVPIRPECRPFLKRYIEYRAALFSKNGYLFPTDHNKTGYLSTNAIRKAKATVEEETGTTFELRACRRTFGQKAVDDGIPPENVSLLMGHSTTETTEWYYCRKRPDKAVRETILFWDKMEAI